MDDDEEEDDRRLLTLAKGKGTGRERREVQDQEMHSADEQETVDPPPAKTQRVEAARGPEGAPAAAAVKGVEGKGA